MIEIKEGRLNLVFGDVNSAKTTLMLNKVSELLKEGKKVLYFSPDTKGYHIRKKIYCLMEDIDLSSVKIDSKTLEPIGIVVPDNLKVIDNCRDFVEDIMDEIHKEDKDTFIFIDNVNQIDFKIDLPYNDKVSKIFSSLNDLGNTIIASFYLIKIADWTQSENFTDDDDKLGSINLIERDDNKVELFDTWSNTTLKYKIIPRNLELKELKEFPKHLNN